MTRSSNSEIEIYNQLLIDNEFLFIELFDTLLSCIPENGNSTLNEEMSNILKKVIRESQILRKDNESLNTAGLMLLYIKNEKLINDSDYNSFVNILNNCEHVNNTRDANGFNNNSHLSLIYDNIFSSSINFWGDHYNNNGQTRAGQNFTYTAVYDAIGGAIGACLGSALPGMGNYLLGTALSTVFSYAADVRKPGGAQALMEAGGLG